MPHTRRMGAESQPRGPAVKFAGVGLMLGGLTLLSDVNLRIAPGSVHALVGPNGAGKTSLLRCLFGQLPHSGRIQIAWPARSSCRIGFVPQTLDFDRHLPVTVADFLTLLVKARPHLIGSRRKLIQAIEPAAIRAGLGERLETRLGALSGGELKRLLLAQALLPEPDLLVLDEPTNHLDAPGVGLAKTLIDELRTQGVTIVLTLHDMGHVHALADQVTGMSQGAVVFSGTPSEVLTSDAVLLLFGGGATGTGEGHR